MIGQARIPTIGLLALLIAAAASPRAAEAQAGAGGGAPQQGAPLNELTPAEKAAGWRLLFDGKTTAGWRVYGADTMSPGWTVVDGALTRTGRAADVITRDSFGDFELSLEWRLSPEGPAGNSGLFIRAAENDRGRPIYYGAPEIQILDDARHRDGRNPLTSAGSNYALHAPAPDAVKPVGEWNHVRVIVHGNHVEQWMNGRKVVEYELHSPDWKARVAASKFAAWPEYGKAAAGHIGLQEHGSYVAFRNIKIREIR